jgi:signal peptide peptidase SppA
MSDHIARSALSRLHGREVAIASHYMGFASDIRALAMANPAVEEAAFLARRESLCAAYGLAPIQQNKPFAFSSGVAIIPVHGSLINRFGSSWGSVTGYNFIRQQTAMAGQDPDVEAIVYDHNSYGGEAAGCFECSADIKQLANGKPTLAVVDSNCYSASYALACGADQITVTPSGGVGSVGVVAMHISMEKMLADWGLEITFIHAGDHKVDGNPFQALPDNVKADMQKSIDRSYNAFVSLVAKGRDMDDKAVRDTEARIYRADDALSLGLIDAIATPQAAVQAFLDGLSGSTSNQRKKDDEMSDATKPGVQHTPVDDKASRDEAASAERTRISGIMTCDEAKGRDALANHLAFKTSMSVDEAKGILAQAPKPAETAAVVNPLAAAMASTGSPNVGSDEQAQEQTTGEAGASGILAAARMAGVRSFSPPAAKQ